MNRKQFLEEQTIGFLKETKAGAVATEQATYDPARGTEVGRSGFADSDVIDQIVNTGVAWHEGQLFGFANQIIGVPTAIPLFGLSLISLLTWLRRRPASSLGAPPAAPVRLGWIIVPLVTLGVMLSLLGASVLTILIVDQGRGLFVEHRLYVRGSTGW